MRIIMAERTYKYPKTWKLAIAIVNKWNNKTVANYLEKINSNIKDNYKINKLKIQDISLIF